MVGMLMGCYLQAAVVQACRAKQVERTCSIMWCTAWQQQEVVHAALCRRWLSCIHIQGCRCCYMQWSSTSSLIVFSNYAGHAAGGQRDSLSVLQQEPVCRLLCTICVCLLLIVHVF
jgi:hypothetical protein